MYIPISHRNIERKYIISLNFTNKCFMEVSDIQCNFSKSISIRKRLNLEMRKRNYQRIYNSNVLMNK